jgi:hypothetical protein
LVFQATAKKQQKSKSFLLYQYKSLEIFVSVLGFTKVQLRLLVICGELHQYRILCKTKTANLRLNKTGSLYSKQELLGQFSSTVEQNCIIKKDDLRAKNL